jgi:hypothetical protein
MLNVLNHFKAIGLSLMGSAGTGYNKHFGSIEKAEYLK